MYIYIYISMLLQDQHRVTDEEAVSFTQCLSPGAL